MNTPSSNASYLSWDWGVTLSVDRWGPRMTAGQRKPSGYPRTGAVAGVGSARGPAARGPAGGVARMRAAARVSCRPGGGGDWGDFFLTTGVHRPPVIPNLSP